MPKPSQQKDHRQYANSGEFKRPKISLNLCDHKALRGPTTTDEEGPLSVFVGSYNAVRPEVPILIKFPRGTARQLGFDLSQYSDYSIETYYCLQEKVPPNQQDKYVSIRPHFAVFTSEEMLDAKRPKGKDQEALGFMREGLRLEIIKACKKENRPIPDKKELDAQIEAYIVADAAAKDEDQFAAIDNSRKKNIQVSVFREMDPNAPVPLLETAESNEYLVLHGGSVSPDNLHLELIQEQEKISEYMTSMVVVPDEKRIILTVHRVLSPQIVKEIEKELAHSDTPWNLDSLPEKLEKFHLPELLLFKKAIEREEAIHQLPFEPIDPQKQEPVLPPPQEFPAPDNAQMPNKNQEAIHFISALKIILQEPYWDEKGVDGLCKRKTPTGITLLRNQLQNFDPDSDIDEQLDQIKMILKNRVNKSKGFPGLFLLRDPEVQALYLNILDDIDTLQRLSDQETVARISVA